MGFSAQQVVDIARFTGDHIIMPSWGKVASENKSDGSPVTEVDKNASAYIVAALTRLDRSIPVISEEATREENLLAMKSPLRWVVDPLDGTQTYIDGPKFGDTAGFGVHIGLIENDVPVKGVVYFPAQKKMFYTGDDGHAYMEHESQKPERIEVHTAFQNGVINASVPWKMNKRPESVNGHDYTPVPAVGGEMICKVASGEADLVWNSRPDKSEKPEDRLVLSHWDIAASHAILKAAGGDIYEMHTGKPLRYGNENFALPTIVAGHVDVLRQIGFNPVIDKPDNSFEQDFSL